MLPRLAANSWAQKEPCASASPGGGRDCKYAGLDTLCWWSHSQSAQTGNIKCRAFSGMGVIFPPFIFQSWLGDCEVSMLAQSLLVCWELLTPLWLQRRWGNVAIRLVGWANSFRKLRSFLPRWSRVGLQTSVFLVSKDLAKPAIPFPGALWCRFGKDCYHRLWALKKPDRVVGGSLPLWLDYPDTHPTQLYPGSPRDLSALSPPGLGPHVRTSQYTLVCSFLSKQSDGSHLLP